ncbi:DUF4440 domain-containing protein [Bacillus sp. FJAT-52991]|uniref:DUF4440 domain-containing protein n=1 Tax=Bacillus kandeliae TaxID=3129297 RepID=A0ABZ2N7U8_9BACI
MDRDLNLKEYIKGLDEKLLRPEVRASPEELNNLLADEFFEYGGSGNIFVKSDFTGAAGVGGGVELKLTLHNFDMHILADDVVLTTYQIKDETRKQNTLRSSIWKYRNEKWQLFFHQGTLTNLPL